MKEKEARKRYKGHRYNAERRCIPFLLTFEQWYQIWLDSGRIDNRGKFSGQYVMARNGDQGPYDIGNVKIVTTNQNHREMKHTEISRAKISATLKGVPKSKRHRRLISEAQVGRTFSIETRKKMSDAAKRRTARMDPVALKKHMKQIQSLRREK